MYVWEVDMKGCFGKFFVFFTGMLLGIVLFAGIIAGVGYYFVAQVTVGEIQEMANQTVLDKNAEINNSSILDVGRMLYGGGLKTITVDEVKTKFGIDLIHIIENSLNVTIEEGPEKEKLKNTAALQLFGQTDTLFNCFTLKAVQSNFGLQLPDFPLIQDHIDEPVMVALNAIMGEFNFDNLTLGDLEYKLGVKLDAEVLQSLKDYSINGMGPALETLPLENVIPNFDRDFYFKNVDSAYILNERYEQITFAEVFTLIEQAETVPEKNRYNYDAETGYYIQDNAGVYKKAEVSGADRYNRTGDIGNYIYTQNINGTYMVADGTLSNERFSFNTETNAYTADRKGDFKFVSEYVVATPENSIDKPLYMPKYVDCIENSDGILKLKQKGFASAVCEADGTGKIEYRLNGTVFERNYGDGANPDWQTVNYLITTEGSGEETKYKLAEDINGEYTIIHIGATERILKTLADCSITTMNSKIGDLTITDVMEIDGDKFRTIEESEKADNGFMDLNKNELFVKINGLYYHYSNANPAHSELPICLRTYKGTTHAAVKQLANIGITNIGTRMNEVLDSLIIRDIMSINDDYYENANGDYVKIDGKYVLYNEAMHGTGVTRYSAPSHVILCKIANVSIGNLGGEMQNIIDTTTIGEIMEIKSENTYTVDENGAYGVLAVVNADVAETSYFGTYNTLFYNDEGVEKCKILVKYIEGLAYAEPTRYNITERCTSPALASMANVTIGNMGSQMQGKIDNMKLQDVIEINGDVFIKLNATEYALAYSEAGNVEIYYNDNNMFRPATESTVTTEYYKMVYKGQTNIIFKKLSTIAVAQVANRIDNAIDDTTLYELGVVNDSTTGVLAQDSIKNAKIKDLPNAINNTLSGATVRQLNEWGNLGMDENVLNALQSANGGNDMTAYDFFSRLEIKGYDPETGNPIFGFKNT